MSGEVTRRKGPDTLLVPSSTDRGRAGGLGPAVPEGQG